MSETGLNLIKKLDPNFTKMFQMLKKIKNKQFFLDNINKTEYKKISKWIIFS
jgi:hypothetical protein